LAQVTSSSLLALILRGAHACIDQEGDRQGRYGVTTAEGELGMAVAVPASSTDVVQQTASGAAGMLAVAAKPVGH
jgi:hypothetical protein